MWHLLASPLEPFHQLMHEMMVFGVLVFVDSTIDEERLVVHGRQVDAVSPVPPVVSASVLSSPGHIAARVERRAVRRSYAVRAAKVEGTVSAKSSSGVPPAAMVALDAKLPMAMAVL
jgi:hypothetical protein